MSFFIFNFAVNFFKEKEEIARYLAEKVQEFHDKWHSEYSNATDVSDLPLSVYKDADIRSKLPLSKFKYER